MFWLREFFSLPLQPRGGKRAEVYTPEQRSLFEWLLSALIVLNTGDAQ